MNKEKITWKVDMYNRVKVVCDNNITIINGVPALSDSYTNFKAKLVIVKDQMEILSPEDNGLVATRDLAWTKLAFELKKITAGLRAYAKKTGNLVLLAQAKYTKSAFTQDRGTEAIALANNLIDLAQTNIASLANYNVTPAKITAATDYLTELTIYNPQPTTQRSSDKALRGLLVKGVEEISMLLKTEMDELVRTLEDEEPLFYGEYFAARRLVHTGIHHKEELTEEEAAAKRLKKEAAKLKKEDKKKEAESKKEEDTTTESKEASPPPAGQPDTNGITPPPAQSPGTKEVMGDAE